MRRPLLTLVLIYAASILGLVLIPGQDAQGNPWHMDFFHAFYFVSFMSTTIGFGEIPYEFTDVQRAWVLVSIYLSVIAWLYAIGTILTLLQDKTFQHAIKERRFAQRIRHLREPFYILCGYGETGRELARALTERGQHVVVVDLNEDKINLRCQPWRAKRRLVDPSSREAALFSRRALRQRENKVGLRTRRPVIGSQVRSSNELAKLLRSAW
ncbi:ion channel [Thiolapillus sp.]|nr:ion channel [Thiolapillus sp.]